MHGRHDPMAMTGENMTSLLHRNLAVLVSSMSVAMVLTLAANSHAQGVPQTDDEKAFYSIGTSMAAQLERAKPISESELDILVQGVRDSVRGKTLAVDQQEGATLVRTMLQERQEKAVAIERVAAAEFLAAEAAKKDAKTTESGLIYTVIKAGKGASPSATDKVSVHYHGTLRDGTVFDSSVERGEPAEFPLNRVIACWTEGVAMMKEGGKSLLVCPAEIAYGDRSTGRIPAGAALSFEVELIEIVE
jgi:FKBP-type peptidyl-prolyl cis-trans isomerase